MNVDSLTNLSYKDLQAQAKQLCIAANQKKEVLIEEILARFATDDNCENVPQKANIVDVVIPSTPSVAKSMRVTRSTVKKAVVVEAPVEVTVLPVAVEEPEVVVQDVSTIVNDGSNDDASVKNVTTSPEASACAVSPTAEEPVEEIEYPAPTMLFGEEREPIDEMYEEEFYEEEYQEIEQDDEVELAEEHAGLEVKGQKIAINRHVYFMSPDAKSKSCLEVVAGQGQKHMHFASPDLQIGQNVHWRYEDYNQQETAAASTTSSEDAAQVDVDAGAHKEPVVVEEESAEEAELASKMAAVKLSPGHNDRVMSFWLTKAFANPVGGFFNK